MARDLAADIRFDPFEGLIALPDVMAALSSAATQAGFSIDRHAIANELQAATFRRMVASDVRVLVSPNGSVAVEVRDSDAGSG